MAVIVRISIAMIVMFALIGIPGLLPGIDIGNTSSGDGTIVTAIHTPHPEISLAPGAKFMLQVDVETADGSQDHEPAPVVFTSDDPGVAVVGSDGMISVSATAAIGRMTVIHIQSGEAAAQSTVIVKYSLEQTAQAAADGTSIVTNPDSLAVVVNKQRKLPDGFIPDGLVRPNVPFSFPGESEKKFLRKEAAEALEAMFRQAGLEGIELNAVSGYRSYETQRFIYEWRLKHQGEEHTTMHTAYPGTSEHQTGLAIDVSSPVWDNMIEAAFGDTKEGKWLEQNAAEFGFIIRYPKEKEAVTGYAYEPWHLRYTGEEMARYIMEKGMTLEEYFTVL